MTRTWWIATMVGMAMASGGSSSERETAARLAKEKLAQQLGVPAAEVEVTAVTAVDWPDTSLGCPEKGMMYAQVITPGHKVAARAGGRTYQVHVGAGRAVVCGPPAPAAPEPAPSGADPYAAAARVSARARRELAARLGVDESAIQVSAVRPMVWPDASLGCAPGKRGAATGSPAASPSAPSPAAEVKGFVIELEHGGKTYRYHADASRLVSCPE